MQLLHFITAELLTIGSLIAAPVLVRVEGNFGPSSDVATVFDNQGYVVSFEIPDPSNPQEQIASPGGDFASALYTGRGSLSVPGIGLFTEESSGLEFATQSGSTWLTILAFRDLPAGDFILATPVQALNGTSLWNGQAGDVGTPVLSSLDQEPASAFWRLQQIPPGAPTSIPLAAYEQGTASITIAPIPEPAAASLFGIGLTLFAVIFRFRERRPLSISQHSTETKGKHSVCGFYPRS